MKSKSAIIQIKATEQYFLVVLTLHKVVLIVSVTIQMNAYITEPLHSPVVICLCTVKVVLLTSF